MSWDSSRIDAERQLLPVTHDELWELLIKQTRINLSLAKMILFQRDGKLDKMADELTEFMDINSQLIELRDKLILREEEGE